VRPFHERREPVLVTLKVLPGLPSLRWLPAARVVGETIRAATARNARKGTGFRIVHVSIQSDHLHMLVEAVARPPWRAAWPAWPLLSLAGSMAQWTDAASSSWSVTTHALYPIPGPYGTPSSTSS